MNSAKKINVNYSSLVGLKAELLRKQTEVNEAKLKAEITRAVPKLKKRNKQQSKQNINEGLKSTQDSDDIKIHKKSKLMLETKAKLYDRLKKSKNNNSVFLVDFINKSDESEEEFVDKRGEITDDVMLENEEDWVEYKDCFGRTRKCLQKDLPFMQEKDDFIKQQIMNKNDVSSHNNTIERDCVREEKEPEIEMMRRKWEEQTEKLADKVNIHYQDILFDEARTHGVGYFGFSQNEEDRIKQQENLFNLRKETERKQREMKQLKELREKMEQNRLKAARVRQRIRAGLPAAIEDEFVQQNNNIPSSSISQDIHDSSVKKDFTMEYMKNDGNAKESNVETKIVHEENKTKALEEFLDKKTHWYEMSQEEWVDKCRSTRVNEFGPVYDKFISSGYLNLQNSNIKQSETESDETYNPNGTINQSIFRDKVDNICTLETTSSLAKPDFNKFDEDHNEKEDDDNITFNTVPVTNTSYTADSKDMQNLNASLKNINEESIAAGLRYLREKFDKKNN